MGASRWRVIRQLLTESFILSGCGACLASLGVWGVRALLLLVPGNIPRLDDPAKVQGLFSLLDWRMVGFTIAVSFVTGILFGLFPALQISNPDIASILKEASGRSATGRKQNRIRKVLVGAEMALALVLLASAALLIRTFVGLSSTDPGIDPHHILTMQISLAGGLYSSTAKECEFTVRVLRRIENTPGVEAAAASIVLPIDSDIDLPFNIAGRTPKKGDLYDGETAAKIVVINQAMAKKYWLKENPIGQVIAIGKNLGPQFDDLPRQIVGIVGDVRENGLKDGDVGVMYVPQSQQPEGLTQLANAVLPLSWSVRSHLDRNSLSALVLREIKAIDGQMPIARVRSMEQILSESTSRQNFNMLLLSIFAGIALLLAAIGIYGLMSYAVQQQTKEFGIRMALGADSQALLRLILKQGMTPALLGVGAGLAIAFGVTRLLGSLLYSVKATDPASFAAVAFTLTAVALAATYLPARRAANADPIVALREQ